MLALLTTATCDYALGTCETQNARVLGPLQTPSVHYNMKCLTTLVNAVALWVPGWHCYHTVTQGFTLQQSCTGVFHWHKCAVNRVDHIMRPGFSASCLLMDSFLPGPAT